MIQLQEIKFGFKQINQLLPTKLQHIVDHDHNERVLNKKTFTTQEIRKFVTYHLPSQKYMNSFLNKGINSFSYLPA